MWPFRPRIARTMTDAEIATVLTRLQSAQRDLDERLEALRSHHLRLRGRVYSLWGKDDPDGPDGASTGRATAAAAAAGAGGLPAGLPKDEIRRRLAVTGRMTPGRPTQHE